MKDLYIRRWLNKRGHHTIGAIHAEVGRWGGSLNISDCDRKVSISIDVGTNETHNTIFKLRTIIDTCQEVINHIEGSEDE